MDQSIRDGKLRESNGKCALCEGEAQMYCKSDEVMLCWDCDAGVHGANFLVARHMRALLCRSCRAPTTWKASGARLTPSASLCSHCCFRGGGGGGGSHGALEGDNQPMEDGEEGEEVEHEDEEEGEGEGEGGDNQVVPWGLPVAVSVTSPVACSSSSDGSTSKRARNDPVDQSSSLTKDDDAEPTSTLIQQVEFKGIKRVVGGDKGISRRRFGLSRERMRSPALAQASVSAAAESQQKAAFSPSTVAGEPSLSCSSARQPISPTNFIQC